MPSARKKYIAAILMILALVSQSLAALPMQCDHLKPATPKPVTQAPVNNLPLIINAVESEAPDSRLSIGQTPSSHCDTALHLKTTALIQSSSPDNLNLNSLNLENLNLAHPNLANFSHHHKISCCGDAFCALMISVVVSLASNFPNVVIFASSAEVIDYDSRSLSSPQINPLYRPPISC
jgi:hypothetical protein